MIIFYVLDLLRYGPDVPSSSTKYLVHLAMQGGVGTVFAMINLIKPFTKIFSGVELAVEQWSLTELFGEGSVCGFFLAWIQSLKICCSIIIYLKCTRFEAVDLSKDRAFMIAKLPNSGPIENGSDFAFCCNFAFFHCSCRSSMNFERFTIDLM